MYSTPTLATRFARDIRVMRGEQPLDEDQMRAVAPSIFSEGKHASRSERYTYIPTIEVLRGLRKEGFEPFMVAQGKSRIEGKAAFTKHMSRMRHAGHRPDCGAGAHGLPPVVLAAHPGGGGARQLAGQGCAIHLANVAAHHGRLGPQVGSARAHRPCTGSGRAARHSRSRRIGGPV